MRAHVVRPSMSKRVLIVEDDPWIAMFLTMLVEDELGCVVVSAPSVAKARSLVNSGIDFALLDVEVEDGVTYDLAIDISHNEIPLAFVSGSDPRKVPHEIAHAPFLRKPVPDSELLALARRYI
jgi:DNA-binding response OmpR family regulator